MAANVCEGADISPLVGIFDKIRWDGLRICSRDSIQFNTLFQTQLRPIAHYKYVTASIENEISTSIHRLPIDIPESVSSSLL